jgi:hypothetical protein
LTGLHDGPEFTLVIAGQAFDTLVRVDAGELFFLPLDGFHRTSPETHSAFGAQILLDPEFQEFDAPFGRAAFFINMGFEFMPEIAQRR